MCDLPLPVWSWKTGLGVAPNQVRIRLSVQIVLVTVLKIPKYTEMLFHYTRPEFSANCYIEAIEKG